MQHNVSRVVVLVGAGATLAAALAARVPKSRLPPLDSTFFKVMQRQASGGLGPLKDYLRTAYGIDPFGSSPGMEEIFNLVYTDASTREDPDDALRAYWTLLSSYATVIRKTTNGLSARSQLAVAGVLRTILRAHPDAPPAFVTFNQDLMIERAIQETTSVAQYRSLLPWDVRTAYPVKLKFGQIIDGGEPFEPNLELVADSVLVAKLHGSLNWVYTVRSGADPKNALRSPNTPLRCIDDQLVRRNVTLTRGGRAHPVVPVVVPPVYEKVGYLSKVLKPAWEAARAALSEAEVLVVFGYSFPSADAAALGLVRQSLHSNQSLSQIHVIDPDPTVVSKVVSIAPTRAISYYPNVRTFTALFGKP